MMPMKNSTKYFLIILKQLYGMYYDQLSRQNALINNIFPTRKQKNSMQMIPL